MQGQQHRRLEALQPKSCPKFKTRALGRLPDLPENASNPGVNALVRRTDSKRSSSGRAPIESSLTEMNCNEKESLSLGSGRFVIAGFFAWTKLNSGRFHVDPFETCYLEDVFQLKHHSFICSTLYVCFVSLEWVLLMIRMLNRIVSWHCVCGRHMTLTQISSRAFIV